MDEAASAGTPITDVKSGQTREGATRWVIRAPLLVSAGVLILAAFFPATSSATDRDGPLLRCAVRATGPAGGLARNRAVKAVASAIVAASRAKAPFCAARWRRLPAAFVDMT